MKATIEPGPPGFFWAFFALGLTAASIGPALALVPHAPSLILLVGLFLAVGAAGGIVEISGNTLLLWSYGSRVSPYMNGLHFAFGVGAIVSPLLIGRILEGTGDLTVAFLLAGAFVLPGAILLFGAKSPSGLRRRGSECSRRHRARRRSNSRGIRLPKALIDEAGLSGEVDIHAEPGLITVRPLESPRKGWAEAVAATSPEGLLDDPTPTDFEAAEWEW